MLRVAYQGAPGAFSESAIAVFWERDAMPVPLHDFEGAIDAVQRGAVDAAVVPVENTRMGIIHDCVAALLRRSELRVLWETDISVRHQLLGPPGSSLESLRRVESHPAALAQCADWIARHPHFQVVAVSDTAAAARDVAASGDIGRAAIGSASAGIRYGLSVLARDLQDDPDNRTRFWAVARGPWQTTAALAVPASGGAGVRDLRGMPVAQAVAQLCAELELRSARRSDNGASSGGSASARTVPLGGAAQ